MYFYKVTYLNDDDEQEWIVTDSSSNSVFTFCKLHKYWLDELERNYAIISIERIEEYDCTSF